MHTNIELSQTSTMTEEQKQAVFEFLKDQCGHTDKELQEAVIQKFPFTSSGPGFTGDLYFALLKDKPSSYYLLSYGMGKYGSHCLEVVPSEAMSLIEQKETKEEGRITSIMPATSLEDSDIKGVMAHLSDLLGGDTETAKDYLIGARVLKLGFTTTDGENGNLILAVFDGGPEYYDVFSVGQDGSMTICKSAMPAMEYLPESDNCPGSR